MHLCNTIGVLLTLCYGDYGSMDNGVVMRYISTRVFPTLRYQQCFPAV